MRPHDPDPNTIDPRILIGKDKPVTVPCHVVRALLPAVAGGDLDPATHAVVERHTLECLTCRREFVGFDEARSALSSLAEGGDGAPQLDESFFDSLHDGIVDELRRDTIRHSDARQIVAAGGKSRAAFYAWLPAAAALVATLVGGFLVGRSFEPAPRIVHVPSGTVSEVSTGDLASPEFGPYLAEALRRYLESSSNEMPLQQGADLSAILPAAGEPGEILTRPTNSKDF